MDNIVAESGLSKGTLYWYFDSKDDLFIAATTSVLEAFGVDSLEALTECETATEKLYALADEIVKLWAKVEGLFSLFVEFWTQSAHREEASKFWFGMLSEYQQIVVAIIEEGVGSGEFRPVDADALVWSILAAYDGLAVYGTLAPDIDLAHVCHVFTDTLVQGLQPPHENNHPRRSDTDR
jgi:AcrR family transcriptional regulator